MATIDGYDLRERPWQPGLDDARFNQQPRNPNFTGGASPEAAAYQRANDLRGMAATERPFTRADARTFGTASTPAPPTSRAGVMNSLRTAYAGTVGNNTHFGPTRPAGKLARTGRAAGGALALVPEMMDVGSVALDSRSTGVDVATQAAEGVGRSASLTVDGYRLGASAAEAQASSYMRRWEADIRQYQAGAQITFNVAKANADSITHANDARMEAAKIGLATGAQRLASAWAMVSADARVSDNTNLSISA